MSLATFHTIAHVPESVTQADLVGLSEPPIAIPVSKIRVPNEEFQRDLQKTHAIFKKEWVPAQAGAIIVYHDVEEDIYWVVDGQHRSVRAQDLGIKYLWAFCVELSVEEAADLFVKLQLDRKNLTPWETFRAQLRAGDEEAHSIVKCLSEVGLQKLGNNGARDIVAIKTVQLVYRKYGADGLANTIRMIDKLWPGDMNGVRGVMLAGMAQFLEDQGGTLTPRMITNLQKVIPNTPMQYAGAAAARISAGGGTAGNALGRAHFVADELLKIARKRA